MIFNYGILNKAIKDIVKDENDNQYKLIKSSVEKIDEGSNYILYPPINPSTAKYFYQNSPILYKCIHALVEDIILGELTCEDVEIERFWKNNQDELFYLCIDYILFGYACGEILEDKDKQKIIAIKQIPADTVKLIRENDSCYVKQIINGNSVVLSISGEVYDERVMRRDVVGNCIWLGGDERYAHYCLPRWYSSRNQIASNIVISDLNIDNIQNGNLLSGVLAISGGRQLPFDDNITFEEKLKDQFGNVGTGLAVCYVENGNRDHELDMKYINLTNNNYSYIKTIYDDNEQSILECFFMPKIRLLNNEGKESMNSNKSETLWKIYLRSCYNIQSNFLDFIKTFNKLYFGKYVKIDIALPTFEDETTTVIQNVEKLMNLGLMNKKQAIEYINQQNSDFKLEYDESLMNQSYDITNTYENENQW